MSRSRVRPAFWPLLRLPTSPWHRTDAVRAHLRTLPDLTAIARIGAGKPAQCGTTGALLRGGRSRRHLRGPA